MNTTPIEQALQEIARRTDDLVTDETSDRDRRAIRDSAELARVLARMVAGKTIHQAFGAPGDWGYEHVLGAALNSFYSQPVQR